MRVLGRPWGRAGYALLPQLAFWVAIGVGAGVMAAIDEVPDKGEEFFSPVYGVVVLASYAVLVVLSVQVSGQLGEPRRVLGLVRTPLWRAVKLTAVVFVGCAIASVALEAILHGGEAQDMSPNAYPGGAKAAIGLALVMSAYCLIGPVAEELYFRGVVYSALRPAGAVAAILLSAALFALVHFVWRAIPVLFVLGAGFALLVARTGSTIPSAVLHVVNNTAAMALALSADDR